MHAPGSMLATFGDLLIFYFLEYEDEDSGEVRFIRLLVERHLDDE